MHGEGSRIHSLPFHSAVPCSRDIEILPAGFRLLVSVSWAAEEL